MKTMLTFAIMMSLTVIANLLLKTGAVTNEAAEGSYNHLLNGRILVGLLSFGLAACCYILILQWLPLSVAISFASAQYIAVILASAWVLSEPISYSQWAGITLITSGIAVIGWSQN